MSKTILITGATGKQGSALILALQDSPFEVLAVTRNTSSPKAIALSRKYPHIKLIQGDMDDCPTIFKRAKQATTNNIWGVYSLQAGSDTKNEEGQAKGMIDCALTNGVSVFVYASIDRGAKQGPTKIPYYASKYRVEPYLERKARDGSMMWTVLRPVSFMDNLTNNFEGKAMAAMWKNGIPSSMPLQLISTQDIGRFASMVFRRPEDFAGQCISLGTDELTFREANYVFRKVYGKDMPSTFGFVSKLLLKMVEELGDMFRFLGEEGTAADVRRCKELCPGMTDFETWLREESSFKGR